MIPPCPAVLGQPVIDPAAWTGDDLAHDQSWLHVLAPAELDDLLRLARSVRKRIGDDPNGLLALTREDLPLGAFDASLAAIRTQIKDGLGVALIRGLPIDDIATIDAAIIYWAIGRHLGHARSNNPDGDMLGHVTDLGKRQDDPTSRGYQTRETMDYHCDQCSIVGLLCVRDARSGGLSKIASAVAVYNELLRREPQAVQLLSQPFYWTKHGEADPTQAPFYQSPVFAVLDGRLCTAFGPKHIEKGHKLPGAPALTNDQRSAISLAEEIAEQHHYPMQLQRGDIQLLNNFTTLHTRTAYEDWPEPNRRRLLYRLWLSAPDIRPATDYVKQWDAGILLNQTRERIVL